MTYRILLLAVIIISPFFGSAQNRSKSIIFETGFDNIHCEKPENDYIRASPESRYSFDEISRTIQSNLIRAHVAVKIEIFPKWEKFGFASGLRYTYLSSSLEKNASPEFFYLLLKQTGTTTEYLRVRMLEQQTSYVGIPLELRYTPFSGRRLNLFFGVGADFNFRVATKNKTTFNDAAMNEFDSEVSDIVSKPDAFYVGGYGRAGVAIGREKPWVTVGLTLPVMLPYGSSSLVQPTFGVGVNVQIIKPI